MTKIVTVYVPEKTQNLTQSASFKAAKRNWNLMTVVSLDNNGLLSTNEEPPTETSCWKNCQQNLLYLLKSDLFKLLVKLFH